MSASAAVRRRRNRIPDPPFEARGPSEIDPQVGRNGPTDKKTEVSWAEQIERFRRAGESLMIGLSGQQGRIANAPTSTVVDTTTEWKVPLAAPPSSPQIR